MLRFTTSTLLTFVLLIPSPALSAAEQQAGKPAADSGQAASATDQMKNELQRLRDAIAALEQRLAAQEKTSPAKAETAAGAGAAPASAVEPEEVKELDRRVSVLEREQATDRVKITGDFRFEAHSIRAEVPAHFDGMDLQNGIIKAMFAVNALGQMPASMNQINSVVASRPVEFQQFTGNLTFGQMKQAVGSMPASMQQQLFGLLMPSTYVPSYKADNGSLFTNRLRLNLHSKIAENVTFSGRLSMYKVFGDSTGVQVFNGQPASLNIDGTSARVPNSDQVRVERAFVNWNRIGGSGFFLSVGRRPSSDGPPMHFRQDELRGGTPSGALIDFQFDGVTAGYNIGEYTTLRLCWGQGYESGWGNGSLIKLPQDRLKDTHFVGANLDLYNTETSLVQFTYAHAYNVTDGFNGLVVMPRDPLTGSLVPAPVVMRYTPSANLGAMDLYGLNLTHRLGGFDIYGSANFSAIRPNGATTPFGGLMSDPFEVPQNRNGNMVLTGVRYNFPNDERTKIGFEYNHGSQYWFNFANAADDIIAPKTNTRGHVFETYLTHRISDRFIFKADYIKYDYDYSGSGWHVGAPKKLDSTPILGFPTYSGASKVSAGLIARF